MRKSEKDINEIIEIIKQSSESLKFVSLTSTENEKLNLDIKFKDDKNITRRLIT